MKTATAALALVKGYITIVSKVVILLINVKVYEEGEILKFDQV